jgi:preprotein translocase subunit YajC
MLMSDLIEAVSAGALLAAAEGDGTGTGVWGPQCVQFMPFFIGMALLAYFFLFLPERRERQRKERLRKDLKKNDRVVTIGGVLGTVAGISPDGNEVTLKIDEATGAKVRVLRSAIHEVLKDESKKDESKKDESKKDPKLEDTKKDEPKGDGSAK